VIEIIKIYKLEEASRKERSPGNRRVRQIKGSSVERKN
jgi:hypothetical protein